MTSFFTPRFPVVAQSWLKTFTSMSSIFNKKKFVVEDTFQFEDFEPTFNFRGMANSDLTIHFFRVLKIGSLAFVQFSYNVDLAIGAGWVNFVSFTIPYTVKVALPGSPIASQGGGIRSSNNSVLEAGVWRGTQGTNVIDLFRLDASNYSAGTHAPRGTFFLEVEE